MTKEEFLLKLRKGLKGLPKEDIEEHINFYSEIIDDRIEDGSSKTDVISEIGAVEDIISQIISDTPITKLVKEKITSKKKLSAWEIILLVLGSPIWISLLLATIAVIFAVYVSLWTLIVSFWAVFISLIACGLSFFAGGIFFLVKSNIFTGIVIFSAGLFCAGLSIFMFFGCKAATKGILYITKKFALCIKNRFIKKEAE